MAVGGALFAVGLALHYILDADAIVQLAVLLPAYLIVGYDVLLKAARNISHGQVFDENFLMTVATLGAFLISALPGVTEVMFPEAVAVMLFFQIGEWFERRAVGKTRKSISDLMNIQPEVAHVLRDGSMETVDPEEVSVGDRIVVLPGEKIPLDGRVVDGTSTLDTRALTGESMPRDVFPGADVVSGTINISSKLTVEVQKEYEDSTAAKVLELVEESVSRKAPTEKFITRFARYYTPAVVGAALVIAVVPGLALGDWVTWVYRALTFLVVSCPCALVISVPLSYFCGIGAASKLGILVKGGNYLEALSKADTVVFDKTGTLTEGRFEVSRVHSLEMADEELLRTAAQAESVSNHPISKSILRTQVGGFSVSEVETAEEIPGKGVRAVIHGRTVHVGNQRLMNDVGAEYCTEEVAGTNVHVAVDGRYMGHIVVSDVVKADAEEAISALKAAGVRRTVMLSGDSARICTDVGTRLGIDDIRYELLPADKTDALERTMADCPRGSTVVYVGDGINDAPSLAMADVGIAMGGLGSDAAIEAADIVIMDDAPSKVPTCIGLSKRVNRIVVQNIVFALGVKFVLLALTLFGYTNMWVAVFGDVGVSIIAILNAMRCMNVSRYQPKEEAPAGVPSEA
ncbi:cadmium-translocating P-type ATPase [Methanomassiliicoccaceae archaeon DOK]|nr:cadmium-translocating P-type ATPase [Methanomassiliicoccaceae archaeon DOK]